MEIAENLTLCRATINLASDVRAGDLVTVDVNDPGMEVYLRNGYLVPTAPATEDEPVEQPQATDDEDEPELLESVAPQAPDPAAGASNDPA